MIKALIFDFDGLMVDTESSAYDSWQEIYQEHGCHLPLEVWAAVLGGSGHEFDPCIYLAQQSGRVIDADSLRARRWQRKLELMVVPNKFTQHLDFGAADVQLKSLADMWLEQLISQLQ